VAIGADLMYCCSFRGSFAPILCLSSALITEIALRALPASCGEKSLCPRASPLGFRLPALLLPPKSSMFEWGAAKELSSLVRIHARRFPSTVDCKQPAWRINQGMTNLLLLRRGTISSMMHACTHVFPGDRNQIFDRVRETLQSWREKKEEEEEEEEVSHHHDTFGSSLLCAQ